MAEALELAERIGNFRKLPPEMAAQELLVGDVVGNLAQTVHVVRKAQEACGNIRHGFKSVAHHGGAGDLAEGADVRKAGRTVTRLEQNFGGLFAAAGDAGNDLARFFEGPCLAFERHGTEI